MVTGAAGFIANKVCEFLLAEGHSVVGVDNLNDYYDVRLKDYRLTRLLGTKGKAPGQDPKVSVYAAMGRAQGENRGAPLPLVADRFTFYPLDIENLEALDEVFRAHKFDAVFNLAARAGVRASLENPGIYQSTNVLGEDNVLKCQKKYGVEKHVLASSSSVYAGCPMPFREDAALGEPQSPYAGTKRAAELLAQEHHERHGLSVTALRYFTVFGPAGRPDMAPFRFVHWVATGQPITLFGDGTASRDFTYVDDIARGTILAARLIGHEVINLGGGNRPITINAMIAVIERELNRGGLSAGGNSQSAAAPVRAMINRQPANPLDMPDTQADIGKAKSLLGWQPQVSPEEGFRRTVEWYLANRQWVTGIRI